MAKVKTKEVIIALALAFAVMLFIFSLTGCGSSNNTAAPASSPTPTATFLNCKMFPKPCVAYVLKVKNGRGHLEYGHTYKVNPYTFISNVTKVVNTDPDPSKPIRATINLLRRTKKSADIEIVATGTNKILSSVNAEVEISVKDLGHK